MSSAPLPCFDELMTRSGVAAYSVAPLGPVEDTAINLYDRWISSGCHGAMDYLERYGSQRSDPSKLLEGARSIICCAFPYLQPHFLPQRRFRIASYALGSDYHEVVRRHLKEIASELERAFGCLTRVCVDTAPLRERYWAARSGLGFIGRNNHLIIPGLGSFFFLGEILTTAELAPYSSVPSGERCDGCGRCLRACPTGALRPDGTLDARRCLSYLTIEHRGSFPPDTDLHGCLYGCDACGAACPHNLNAPAPPVLPELLPRPDVLELTPERVLAMDQAEFSTLFSHSAVKRTKLAGLRRNASALLGKLPEK